MLLGDAFDSKHSMDKSKKHNNRIIIDHPNFLWLLSWDQITQKVKTKLKMLDTKCCNFRLENFLNPFL